MQGGCKDILRVVLHFVGMGLIKSIRVCMMCGM